MAIQGSILDHIINCYGLTVKLLHHIRKGSFKWFIMFIRLLLFTIILIPAWYTLLKELFSRYYASLILFDVPYTSASPTMRNLLDIYLPNNYDKNDSTKKYPVIIFVSGGAWIIGYKLWSFIIAMPLAKLGCIVVVPDYRNFPQGNIDDMMIDIYNVLQWTYDHIETQYHGDMNQIVLAGQSAGAHITLCVLVEEFKKSLVLCRKETMTSASASASNSSNNSNINSKVTLNNIDPIIDDINLAQPSPPPLPHHLLNMICTYIGISGPYDLITLCSHMHKRCLDSTIFNDIFHNDLLKYSPTRTLQQLLSAETDAIPHQQGHHHHRNSSEERNGDNNDYFGHINDDIKQKHTAQTVPETMSPTIEVTGGTNDTLPIAAVFPTTTTTTIAAATKADLLSHHIIDCSPLTTVASTSQSSNNTDDDDKFLSEQPTPRNDGSSDVENDDNNSTWYSSKGHLHHHSNDNSNGTSNTSHRNTSIFQSFPPVILYHGLSDVTIPHHTCTDLGQVLSSGGVPVRVTLIPHWSHTDGILEAPLQGDDSLLVDIMKQLKQLQQLKNHRTSAAMIVSQSKSRSRRKSKGGTVIDNTTTQQQLKHPSNFINHKNINNTATTSSATTTTTTTTTTTQQGWYIENLAENEPLNKLEDSSTSQNTHVDKNTSNNNNNNNNNISNSNSNSNNNNMTSTLQQQSNQQTSVPRAILCIGIHHTHIDTRRFSYRREANIILVQIAKLFNPF